MQLIATLARAAPVQYSAEDLQWQACDADVPHKALSLELLQGWQSLINDLRGTSHREAHRSVLISSLACKQVTRTHLIEVNKLYIMGLNEIYVLDLSTYRKE